jgi:hypothetical protein
LTGEGEVAKIENVAFKATRSLKTEQLKSQA